MSVYLPAPARDPAVGLDLGEGPGCRTLDPTEALAYVRSRHYEEFIGGRWVEDPRSDLGRIARQQDFIRRALSRAIDRGARNPGTLDQLIDVGLSGITVDGELTAGDIFDLGTRFRSFDPDSLLTYSVTGTPDVVNGAQILRLDEGPETEATFAVFRGGTGTELVPASVRLTVRNGTGVTRQGAEATAALRGVGFSATVAGDEPGGGDGRHGRPLPARPGGGRRPRRPVAGRRGPARGGRGRRRHRAGHRHRLAGRPHRGCAVDLHDHRGDPPRGHHHVVPRRARPPRDQRADHHVRRPRAVRLLIRPPR